MQVTRDRQNKTLTISQENYTKSDLEKFGMANCKSSSTPGYAPGFSTKQAVDTLLNEEETQWSSHYGLGDVSRSNHKVQYHVQHLPTRSCYVEAFEGAHGRGIAPAEIPGWNYPIYPGLHGGFELTAFSDSNWGQKP